MKIGMQALIDVLNLKEKNLPLIHCISSIMGMSDLAQAINSYYGKAIMSNSIEDVGLITSKAKGLYITLANLDRVRVEVIEKALRMARLKGIPTILKTTEINYSDYRKVTTTQFLSRYRIDVILTNLSEVSVLLDYSENIDGKIKELSELKNQIRKFARKHRTIVVVTADKFYITDGFSDFFINNELFDFNRVTNLDEIIGGLMATGISVGKSKAEYLNGILVAILELNECKILAINRLKENEGLIKFKEYLLDQISLISKNNIIDIANIEFEFKRKE